MVAKSGSEVTHYWLPSISFLKRWPFSVTHMSCWAFGVLCVCVCVCVCVCELCVCVWAEFLSCVPLCHPVDCSPPGSSVHGLSQAKILKWVAISFSRGSSRPRDQTHISCISFIGRWIFFYPWTTREALDVLFLYFPKISPFLHPSTYHIILFKWFPPLACSLVWISCGSTLKPSARHLL